MDLANQGRWEEAQVKATALHEMAPKSAVVERVYTWVVQTAQQRREQALENEIREIDAKNSVFSPTIQSLLKENKDRGLPATQGYSRRGGSDREYTLDPGDLRQDRP